MAVSEETMNYWIEYLRSSNSDNTPDREIADFLEGLRENRHEVRVVNRAQYSYIKSQFIRRMMFGRFGAHDIWEVSRMANIHTDVLLELFREYEAGERGHDGKYPATEQMALKIKEIKARRQYSDAAGDFDLDAYSRSSDEWDAKALAEGTIDKTSKQLHAELMQRVRENTQ